MEILIREFNENATDVTRNGGGDKDEDEEEYEDEDDDDPPQRARLAIQRLNAIHNQYGHYVHTN